MKNSKDVSVVIPVYNGGDRLIELVAVLKKTDFEIVIIDSDSTDGTSDYLKEYADKYILIDQKEFDHGGTRWLGAKQAKGDFIIFITQDVVIENIDSFKKIIDELERKVIGASYGRQIAFSDSELITRLLRDHNYPERSQEKSFQDKGKFGIMTCFLSDAFSAYRRDVLEEVGGFKSDLIFGEDMEIASRILEAGYNIYYNSEAIVKHSHDYTIRQNFKRSFDNGVFHKENEHILKVYGKASREGIKLLKKSLMAYSKNNLYMQIPILIFKFASKYLGYKLGYNYRILPKTALKRFSMNKKYWEI